MKIAEYKQISTIKEQRIIHHDAEYDEAGNMITGAWDETIDVEVPVMGMVYRDATQEEIAEMEKAQAEMTEPEYTQDERLSIMEDAFAELCEVIFNG